uniref:hypothetical protein n=2 Tax=Roseivirga sp. TaxID=1964215 RepID=UPI0040488D97
MLKTKKFALLTISLVTLVLFSCGGKGGGTDPLTPEEQRLVDLAGSSGITYVASSVMFENALASGFENFSLTFRGTETSKTYSTVDGDPVFSASGTWDFNGTNINQIVIDNNTSNVFNISNFDASAGTFTLTVNFVANGGVAAGTNSTNGTYVFNLVKQ